MRKCSLSANCLIVSSFAIILLFAASPAAAQDQDSAFVFEIFGGYYFPETDVIDDDITYGLRGGIQRGCCSGYIVSLSQYSPSTSIAGFDLDVDLTLVDFSYLWTPNPGGRTEFFLTGGLGWGFLDVDAGFADDSEDSVSVNGGFALMLHPKNRGRFYVRPEIKGRWFEGFDDEVDIEATVALGFFFPRN